MWYLSGISGLQLIEYSGYHLPVMREMPFTVKCEVRSLITPCPCKFCIWRWVLLSNTPEISKQGAKGSVGDEGVISDTGMACWDFAEPCWLQAH